MSDRWSPAFTEYFSKYILDAVIASAAFATSDIDIVSVPYVGITNNVSDSYNRVLKDFHNWEVITQFYLLFTQISKRIMLL